MRKCSLNKDNFGRIYNVSGFLKKLIISITKKSSAASALRWTLFDNNYFLILFTPLMYPFKSNVSQQLFDLVCHLPQKVCFFPPPKLHYLHRSNRHVCVCNRWTIRLSLLLLYSSTVRIATPRISTAHAWLHSLKWSSIKITTPHVSLFNHVRLSTWCGEGRLFFSVSLPKANLHLYFQSKKGSTSLPGIRASLAQCQSDCIKARKDNSYWEMGVNPFSWRMEVYFKFVTPVKAMLMIICLWQSILKWFCEKKN